MKVQVAFTHKYYPSPRLSANQVGEYLTANATNRRRILSDAKYPPTMKLVRYDDAKRAISAHLTDGGGGTILLNAIDVLTRKASADGITPWKKQNCSLCCEAIEAFQSTEQTGLGMGGAKFRADIANLKLKISGVVVSVALDLPTECSGMGNFEQPLTR